LKEEEILANHLLVGTRKQHAPHNSTLDQQKKKLSVELENNRLMKILIRMILSLLVAGALTLYVHFNFLFQGEKLLMYSLPILISIYILTGMVNIVNPQAKIVGLGIILFWFLYDFFVKGSYNNKDFALYLFSIITVSASFALITRIVAHLFFRLQTCDKIKQEDPKLFEIVNRILHEDWDPKGQNKIKDQLNSIFDYSVFIPQIFFLLKDKKNSEKITTYLSDTMKHSLGVTPNKVHNQKIAELIVRNFEENNV
jgi:hypothetical protein